MKLKLEKMILLGLIACLLMACDEADDGFKKLPNIFDENGGPVLTVDFLSNADTVFFTWDLVDEQIEFDYFRVSQDNTDNSVEADKNEEKCFLTQIPYNKVVPVTISLIQGNEPVQEIKTSVQINGLDTVFAQIVVPDRGSVTGGDGTYSIALPDGRSIFLMGDSYI